MMKSSKVWAGKLCNKVIFLLGVTALCLSLANVSYAAVGDLIKTVNLPPLARCDVGTSVGVVPGSLIGFPAIPILLVSSCRGGEQLFYLDPSTDPATLVKAVTTSPTPRGGWGSLALRADRNDLIGCGNAPFTHPLYRIDPNTGEATFLFNTVLSEFPICDGLTWDATNQTFFVSADVSDTVSQFSASGFLLNSFPAASGCQNSGLAVGGSILYEACDGTLIIFRVNKGDGSVIDSFHSAGQRTEDLECDPISFAGRGVDVIWSKDAFTNQIFAFEIPRAECGLGGQPPLPPPANNPPRFDVPPTPACGSSLVAMVGQPLSLTVQASDPDSGQTVSLAVSGLPSGASFPIPSPGNPVSSIFSWTPAAAQVGTHTITFTATDNLGLAASPACVITIQVASGPGVLAGLNVTKRAADVNGGNLAPGDIIEYTIVIENSGGPQGDNPGPEFEDPIPANTSFVAGSASASSGNVTFDSAVNKIVWNGSIAVGGSVTISFRVQVNPSLSSPTTISNQGFVHFDSNGDGTNDAVEPTDDPNTAADNDPTVVTAQPLANRPPICDARVSEPIALEGEMLTFDGSGSVDPEGDPISFNWTFGDGSSAADRTVQRRYADNGTFTVTLTCSDGKNISTDTVTVPVNNVAPLVEAGPDQKVNKGQLVQFSGSFIDPGTADTHTILWDFGDGTSATNTLTPSHTYSQAAAFTVTLIVRDDDGGEGKDILTVIVDPPGDADLDGDVDVFDMLLIARFLLGQSTLDPAQRASADANQDGVIDLSDIARIAHFLVGNLETVAPRGTKTVGKLTSSQVRKLNVLSKAAKLEVESKTLLPGEKTALRITAAPGLGGLQGGLSFDPAVIQVNAIRALEPYQLLASQIDKQSGRLKFLVIAVGTEHPSGPVVELDIVAVGQPVQSSSITLRPDALIDPRGNGIEAHITNGSITLTQPENPSLGPLKVDAITHTPSPVVKTKTVTFVAEGSGIKSIEVAIFNLRGKRVFHSGEVLSHAFDWALESDEGRRLANGVYLYIVTVRGFHNEMIRSQVKKLAILR